MFSNKRPRDDSCDSRESNKSFKRSWYDYLTQSLNIFSSSSSSSTASEQSSTASEQSSTASKPSYEALVPLHTASKPSKYNEEEECCICGECDNNVYDKSLYDFPCRGNHTDRICFNCFVKLKDPNNEEIPNNKCPLCRGEMGDIIPYFRSGEDLFWYFERLIYHDIVGTVELNNGETFIIKAKDVREAYTKLRRNSLFLDIAGKSFKKKDAKLIKLENVTYRPLYNRDEDSRYVYYHGRYYLVNEYYTNMHGRITLQEVGGGCFTDDAKVTILNSDNTIRIIPLGTVEPGMHLKVDNKKFAKVKNVIKTSYEGDVYTLPNGLRGTPWHPVFCEKKKNGSS